jgi:hypothetical protein
MPGTVSAGGVRWLSSTRTRTHPPSVARVLAATVEACRSSGRGWLSRLVGLFPVRGDRDVWRVMACWSAGHSPVMVWRAWRRCLPQS